jgi:hypothetical protein
VTKFCYTRQDNRAELVLLRLCHMGSIWRATREADVMYRVGTFEAHDLIPEPTRVKRLSAYLYD